MTIKRRLETLKLQEIEVKVWLRALLSYLVEDFAFHSKSPFETGYPWQKTIMQSEFHHISETALPEVLVIDF
jgi:hypothetical protein